jgi:gamma-glutamyltranspeptidase/glutathione hydrolase
MVAAAHPLAAAAGARVLAGGGNAFDAAVATAAALNVAEPFMSGLAGAGMATIWSAAEHRVRALDYVTPVPLAFEPAGLSKQDVFRGAAASVPPGSLAGWARLAADYGTRPLGELLAPAIELAQDGVPVTRTLPEVTTEWLDLRRQDPEWLRVYTDGQGGIPAGWVLRQPDLARTLEAIASHGPAHLYSGQLGDAMIGHLQAHGGYLSRDDLAGVEPLWVEPLAVGYRDLLVHAHPPPAESFQFLLTLAVLEHFDLGAMPSGGIEHLDAVCRAIRLAAEARIRHNRLPRAEVQALLEPGHASTLAERVRDGRPIEGRTQQWGAVLDPAEVGQREHTTSFSVADADGNMVCVTQSLGSIYGSGVVIPGTGVCMNNFLNWGDLEADSPNHLVPGSRLAMCLAPSISTRDGEPVLALGTPGSYGILQTQVQVMVRLVDHGMALQDAIEAPRVRLWDGTLAQVESRIDGSVIEALRERGHDARATAPWTRKVGGFHAVARDPRAGVLTGGADPRRDGYAMPV